MVKSKWRILLEKQLRSLKARIAYLDRRNGNFLYGEYAKWVDLFEKIESKTQEIANLDSMGL